MKNPFEILQIRELPSSIVRDDEVTKEEVAKSRLSFLIVFTPYFLETLTFLALLQP